MGVLPSRPLFILFSISAASAYGKADVGIGAPIGDSLYGLVWFLTTQFVATSVPQWLQVTLITLFMFVTLVVSY